MTGSGVSELLAPVVGTGSVTFFEGWKFFGNFTTVDLVAASTNALNGALLARPLLGRKLHGKSQRELRDLGLLVEKADAT